MPTLDEQVEWWTKQAAHDLEMAKSNRQNGFHDGCALMCQQDAEKYLKALLEELGIAVTKTHDLKKLLTALQSHYPALRQLTRGLGFLTRFAVQTRYPGRSANKRDAAAAPRWADRVRTAARTILKLPLHPPRRRK